MIGEPCWGGANVTVMDRLSTALADRRVACNNDESRYDLFVVDAVENHRDD